MTHDNKASSYPEVRRHGPTTTAIIDDFVSSKEAQCVRVAFKGLHHSEDPCEIPRVVARPWATSIQTLPTQRRVDIKKHVDSNSVEDTGAKVVIQRRIQVIDAQGVQLRQS